MERDSAQPQEDDEPHQAREAGASFSSFAPSPSLRLHQSLSGGSAGWAIYRPHTWGCALSRSTPGFTLSPASAG